MAALTAKDETPQTPSRTLSWPAHLPQSNAIVRRLGLGSQDQETVALWLYGLGRFGAYGF